MLYSKQKGLPTYSRDTFLSLEPAVGVGSKNPLLRYILIPLLVYVENFKVLGSKLWEEFPLLCQKRPVKYKSKIDRCSILALFWGRAGLYTLLYQQIADSIYFLKSYFLKQKMAFLFSYWGGWSLYPRFQHILMPLVFFKAIMTLKNRFQKSICKSI